MPEIEEQRVDDAERAAESTADDLAERSERVGDNIEQTRRGWEGAKQDDDVPTAAGDWEDTEPDDSTGDDPAGFDDPENLDLDDEDLTDDESSGDDEDF
jgi:hypothetical protein